MSERNGGDGYRARTSDSGSFIVDAGGTILGFDERLEGLTGWSAAEVVGRERVEGRSLCVVDEGGRRRPLAFDVESLRRRSGVLPLELHVRCADGRLLDVEASAFRTPGAGDRVTVVIHRVLAATEGPADPAEPTDALTGLATRESFLERLDADLRVAARNARPLAVILADVDHLRKVGDRFGREAENGVLRKIAGILRATVRDEDLIARLGGDDFALVLSGIGRGSARQIAARLRSTVERFRFLHPGAPDGGLRLTLSLGAATFPADADGPSDLLARAEDALREARALGRNRVWCYTRRPRVPLRTPVYLDGSAPLLLGYTKDLSPSGLFVSTPAPIDIGMRCAISFPLPTSVGNVHVIGRVVRAVPLQDAALGRDLQVPGMGIEFERFGAEDRRAIESFLYENEARSVRPEDGRLSVAP